MDSTQSDDQTTGSINFLASHGTLSAYFGQHFHQYDPSLLSNHGLSAGIDEVKLRQGSILQPEWPAALGCRAHTFTKLKGAVRAVLAQATSGQVMAGTAVYVIAYWRMRDTNGQWILCTDGIAVGHGARPFSDGLDAIYQRHNENYPGEFMEMEYPLRMERYAIMPDSGGAGKFRGGCGVIREVRLLADTGTFGLRVENNIFPTWGVSGGMGGAISLVGKDVEHAFVELYGETDKESKSAISLGFAPHLGVNWSPLEMWKIRLEHGWFQSLQRPKKVYQNTRFDQRITVLQNWDIRLEVQQLEYIEGILAPGSDTHLTLPTKAKW